MSEYEFNIYIYSKHDYQFYMNKINAFEIISNLNDYFYPQFKFKYATLENIFELDKNISFCLPFNNAEIFGYLEQRDINSYSQIKRNKNTYTSYNPIKTKFDYWDIKQDTKIIFLKGTIENKYLNYFLDNGYKIIKLNYNLIENNFVIMPFNFSFSNAEDYFYKKNYLNYFKQILDNLKF